jgi:hypothetical protein
MLFRIVPCSCFEKHKCKKTFKLATFNHAGKGKVNVIFKETQQAKIRYIVIYFAPKEMIKETISSKLLLLKT